MAVTWDDMATWGEPMQWAGPGVATANTAPIISWTDAATSTASWTATAEGVTADA